MRDAGKVGSHEYPQKVTRADFEAVKPDSDTRRWLELRDHLRAVLSPQEFTEAARSTQYAHYTCKAVVQSMWRALDRMGFKGVAVLEPGAGILSYPEYAKLNTRRASTGISSAHGQITPH